MVPGRCWRRHCRPRSPPTSPRTPARSTTHGRRLVVRNGYHAAREVTTAAGAVMVRQPRVNDKRVDEITSERQRFSSAILPAWSRKSPRVAEVLPLLYLHGLSVVGFRACVDPVPGLRPGPVASHHHPTHHAVARRSRRVRVPVVGRVGLHVRVGRRHPPEGPAGGRQGLPAGDDRGPRRRPQGADRARRRVPRISRVLG